MPLIVSAKDAAKYGATKNAAGNYEVGYKAPTSSSGSSSTSTASKPTVTKSSGGSSSASTAYSGVTPSAALLDVAKQAGISTDSLLSPQASSGQSLNIDYLNKLLAARGNTTADTTSITTDSTSAVSNENALKSEIDSLLKRSGLSGDVSSYIDPLYNLRDEQLSQIDKERAALEQRRANEIAGIQAGYEVANTNLTEAQKKETGATSMGLATAGGYLGVTASQQGVLQNLAQAQRQELFALQAQKDDALRQANNAYEDRDFELVREKLQAARDIEQQVFDRRDKFLNQQLSILGEMRAQAQDQRLSEQFQRDMANERIDRLITAGITPSGSDIIAIAREIGMSPDETKRMFDAAKASKALEDKAQRTNNDVAILNTLRGIPRDQTVVIDGVSYRGLAELSNTSSTGGTATEREAAKKKAAVANLMQNIQGRDADGNKVDPITLQQAILEYGEDLSVSEITDIFKTLQSAETQQAIKEGTNVDVYHGYDPDTGKETVTFTYDKGKYKAALKKWEDDSKAAWYNWGAAKGTDQTVTVDGTSYTGTKETAPSPYNYRITNPYGD
jgi:hypothetical protein